MTYNPNSYYPWDLWFDGDKHTIQRGVDFSCETSSMHTQLYSKATGRGLKITAHRDEDTITFSRKRDLTGVYEFYKLERFILDNSGRLEHESDRRNLSMGAFLTNVLDDALGVYENQKDFELEEMRRTA